MLHGGLSSIQRYKSWQRIKSTESSIVIGSRLAIFSPVKNLGLIIVDEEQEMIVLEMNLKDSNAGKGRPDEVLQLLFDAQGDELVELVVCKVDSL